ncbi:MAG: CpsD/CapB family tyrosine-protein kinase, partial [Halanaerobium sp.]|nr:CpsD/CapB family tyrosine-protein kinase [Halanaerobium sp.]
KEEMKSLVLLSPGREVGRTVIAARLAEAYSRFGSRVLLIDGDLSNPIIHEIYKLGKEPGFSDLLNGEAAYAEVINQVRPGLEIITAGSFAAGREIFLPGRVKEVLGELSRLYDLILLDSSAAKSSADSILLASCTDAAILVCQTGRTTINELKDLQAQLAMVDARSAGIIINRV